MNHTAMRSSTTAATAPMIIPTIAPIPKLLPDAGCIEVASADGPESVYVIDAGPGVSIDVSSVACVVWVANESVSVDEVADVDFASSEDEVLFEGSRDWVESCVDDEPVVLMASPIDDFTDGVRDWSANSCMSHLTDVVVAL